MDRISVYNCQSRRIPAVPEYTEEVATKDDDDGSTGVFWISEAFAHQKDDSKDRTIFVKGLGLIKISDVFEEFAGRLIRAENLVTPYMLFLEDDMPCAIGNHTHCIVEFGGSAIRCSLQLYKGISTWFYMRQKITIDETGPTKDPTIIRNEILGKNLMVPGRNTFNLLEAISNKSWLAWHRNCRKGHFRVNIHMATKGSIHFNIHGGFITHKVCGGALLSDLFWVVLGISNEYLAREVPDEHDGWVEALWENLGLSGEDLYTTTIGRSYRFRDAWESRITIEQTGWFKDKDYVWLLPISLEKGQGRVPEPNWRDMSLKLPG